MTHPIFAPTTLGPLSLRNRFVMSPMTRSRAVENVPNALMATYYAQRAGAGLIVTEGTSPSPNGLGYARIPGLFSAAQVEGWSKTTAAVHAKGGKIFVQLMHTGRVSHPLNLGPGGAVLAPSAVRLGEGQMYTDAQGMQDYPTPRAMSGQEVKEAVAEYATAARNAVKAGFDGIELHGANGYLIEQFLSPHTNQRTDGYGGSVEKRLQFVLEVARATADAIGKERVGIRLSPHGVFNAMAPYPEIEATYFELAQRLSALGLVYLHVLDHSAMGGPPVPESLKRGMRERFQGTFIASGGLDLAKAEALLDSKAADLVGFARAFLANPDLVERLAHGWPLNAPDLKTFYTPGVEGYTDYPSHAA